MKKKMTLMMAGVLAVGILATGCGNKNAETTADTAAETTTEATGESKVDGETAAAAGERTTFTVGFDAIRKMVNMSALIWTWLRRSVTVTAGSL